MKQKQAERKTDEWNSKSLECKYVVIKTKLLSYLRIKCSGYSLSIFYLGSQQIITYPKKRSYFFLRRGMNKRKLVNRVTGGLQYSGATSSILSGDPAGFQRRKREKNKFSGIDYYLPTPLLDMASA